MKKLSPFLVLFATTTILLFTNNTIAQEKSKPIDYNKGWRVGGGLSTGVPHNDGYDFSVGADTRVQYDFSKKTSLSLTTGYTHLFSKDLPDLGFVPLKAGFKYFFIDKFYGMGEIGGGIGTHKGMNNFLLFAPSIGYATKYFDVSLKHEFYPELNTDQIALRIAYGFRL